MKSMDQQHVGMSTTPANQNWIQLVFLALVSYLSSVYNKIYSLPRLTLDLLIFAKIFVIIMRFHEVFQPQS